MFLTKRGEISHFRHSSIPAIQAPALERFQTIILFGDNDEPGRKMIREVVRR